MTKSLSGKVAVVTGGARGIGFAIAKALADEGLRVAIGDVDEAALAEAAADLGLDTYGRLDVTDSESFRAFLADVESRLGPIDVLVNNAGIMPVGPLLEETERAARRMVDINVHGVISGTKLALASMLPRKTGHIVNVGSMAGETYVPGEATYTATKYAVVGFTDGARVEYRTSGVNFSVVLPGFIDTELTAGTAPPRFVKKVSPDDVAAGVVRALKKPTAHVYVPRSLGYLVRSQRFIPRSWAEALSRSLGSENTFLSDVDHDARRAYEERIRNA